MQHDVGNNMNLAIYVDKTGLISLMNDREVVKVKE